MPPARCNPLEHTLSRRRMLGAAAAGAAGVGLGGLIQPAVAEELKRNDKQVLLMWLDGGMSQLESWDPKPNTPFGGLYPSAPHVFKLHHSEEQEKD
jgi:hypothetical protein